MERLRRIDLSAVNRILAKIGAGTLRFDIPASFRPPEELAEVPARCKELVGICKHWIDVLAKYEGTGRLDRLVPFAAPGKEYQAHEMGHQLPVWRIKSQLEDVVTSLNVLQGGVLLLRSPAGQGKTNFVCDLAELMLKYEIPCIFLTGREIDPLTGGDLTAEVLACARQPGEPIADTISRIRRLCSDTRMPLVVIVDAINEHPNVAGFARRLESLLEALIGLGFVRVVITCRSEYFEHRFANLTTASFADSLHVIDDLHLQMDRPAQERMLAAYLEFFKIRTTFSGSARERLMADPFLLRIFCEAYGDMAAPKPLDLPHHLDIYKDRLFSRYLDRRFADLADRHIERGSPSLGIRVTYMSVLTGIVSAMLAGNSFDGVGVTNVPPEQWPLVEDLLHEDVIIRKDMRQPRENSTPEEILTFPFDELRDYLVAKHIVGTFDPANPSTFREKLRALVNASNTAGEGIGRFLFWESKRATDASLYKLIIAESWMQDILIDCVFGVEEALLTDAEIAMVRQKCLSDNSNACGIVQRLILRLSPEANSRLGVRLLISLIDALRAEHHIGWIYPLFEVTEDRLMVGQKCWWPIEAAAEQLAKGAERAVKSGNQGFALSLVELLLCLLPLAGRDYSYPANRAALRLVSSAPSVTIGALKARLRTTPTAESRELWDLTADIYRTAGQHCDGELLEMAIAGWRKPATPGTTSVLADVLRTAKDSCGYHLPSDIDEVLQKQSSGHARELERWLKRPF